jgi:hypothetical protein
MCAARRCGDRRDSALAAWGRCDGQTLRRAWGFTPDNTPCAATLDHGRRHWDAPLGEATLGAWAERVRTALPAVPGAPEAMAMEGQTRRGSRTPGAPATPLLAVRRHRWGLTRWPQAVADATTALPVLEDVRRARVVAGRVITVEAWLTPRAIAERLGHGGGDEVLRVTGHPPQRPHALQLVCQATHAAAATVTTAALVDSGPGRREPRRLTASSALGGDRDGPGLAQVCHRARRVTMKTPGEQPPAVV